jgi:ABC-2 type transport system permease protein
MVKKTKELYAYREMILSLVRRDLRGRYKGSVLGFLWTFINPLLQLLVYTIVFSTILDSGIEKYYLFLFVGLIPWLFLSSCLTGGSAVILNEKSLVTKIYFPREVLPIAYVTSSFINMILCFLVVFAVIFISGAPISLAAWPLLLPIMLVEYILALGITLASSAITVYFRDLQHILGIVSMAWMFMTPIMYADDIIPEGFKWIFAVNPMTSIIKAYREVLFYARIPDISLLTKSFLFGIGGLLIGAWIFNRSKLRFAEEL